MGEVIGRASGRNLAGAVSPAFSQGNRLAGGGATISSEGCPNKPVLDEGDSVIGGCPIESRDGLALFTASAREESSGDLDIWVNLRSSVDAPFGPAYRLPATIKVSVSVPFLTEAQDETRASFSGDLRRINYGSAGEIYVTECRWTGRHMLQLDVCRKLDLPFCFFDHQAEMHTALRPRAAGSRLPATRGLNRHRRASPASGRLRTRRRPRHWRTRASSASRCRRAEKK